MINLVIYTKGISWHVERQYTRGSKDRSIGIWDNKRILELKKEFGEEKEKTVKAAELRRIEQGEKMMEEFIQKLRKAARGSKYEIRFLIKKFKQNINRIV